VDSPANCPGALAVTGVRHAGTKVGYSNLGPEAGVAAPAGNCINLVGACLRSLDTTTNTGTTTPAASDYTDEVTRPNVGTSFSAPLVAATAGLMKSVNPALTPALLTARIRSTARPFPGSSDTVPAPPVCQTPTATAKQDAECICTTALCGAGLLDTAAAVTAALQPAVLAQVTGIVGIGRVLTLDGSQSSVATGVGRTAASYAWTVVSTSGGAGTPAIINATQAVASVESPAVGSYTLRLTLTDNLGASDNALVTVTAAGTGGSSGSTSPPPSTASGGGGTLSPMTVLLLALFAVALMRRARHPH
jgi:serine protease